MVDTSGNENITQNTDNSGATRVGDRVEHVVSKPVSGQEVSVHAVASDNYILDFNIGDADVSQNSDNQLTLTFNDQSRITFVDLAGYEDGQGPQLISGGEQIDIPGLFELLAELRSETPLETAAGNSLSAQGGGGSVYDEDFGESLEGLTGSGALGLGNASPIELVEQEGDDQTEEVQPAQTELQGNDNAPDENPIEEAKAEDCELELPVTSNLIEGDERNNTLRGTDQSDEIRGYGGHDRIYGSDSADVIIGGQGNDSLRGEGGDDVFLVEGSDQGADRFNGGTGNDTIHGSEGDDVITVSHLTQGDSIEEIDGCGGTNVLSGTDRNNTIDLTNTVLTNVDRIEGGAGHDRITGSSGDDNIVGGTGNDYLRGGAGNDAFVVEGNNQGSDRYNGGSGTDKIQGTDGDQTLVVQHLTQGDSIEEIDLGTGTNVLSGTDRNNTIDLTNTTLTNVDRIEGGAGHDRITGSSGDDNIVGGTGNDYLRGGAGNDTFVVEGNNQGSDRYNGGTGTDKIQGSDGDQTLVVQHLTQGDSIEEVDLGTGTNVLSGTDRNNTIDLTNTTLTNVDRIEGGAGHDRITGSSGDDNIVGGTGNDYLRGGAGNDTFVVEGNNQGSDRYNGGSGTDKIQGTDGDQTLVVQHLTQGDSIEEIDLGTGTNVLSGTDRNNTIDLTNTTLTNVDRIEGGAGHDRITGSSDDDIIVGGTGNDYLRGGAGDDIFIVEGSNQGSDRYNGGSGTDKIQGSDGDDTLIVQHFTLGDSVEVIDLGAGLNTLMGTSGNNTIDLSNTLLTGVDTIDGGAGHDRMTGSDGDDILIGGEGNDVLRGGNGNDSFTFNLSLDAGGNSSAEGRDTVMDFQAGDKLVFSDIISDLGDPADPLSALDSLGDVSVVDGGAGRNVSINFGDGDSITLRGLGTAGNMLDSLQDLEDHGILIDVL